MSISLKWTAPGDDGDWGNASRYEIRFSEAHSALTECSFGDSQKQMSFTSSQPLPSYSMEIQNFILTQVEKDTILYVGLRAIDDAGNYGQVSNIVPVFFKGPEVPTTTSTSTPVKTTSSISEEIITSSSTTSETVQTTTPDVTTGKTSEPKENTDVEKVIIISTAACGGFLLLLILVNVICYYMCCRKHLTGSKGDALRRRHSPYSVYMMRHPASRRNELSVDSLLRQSIQNNQFILEGSGLSETDHSQSREPLANTEVTEQPNGRANFHKIRNLDKQASDDVTKSSESPPVPVRSTSETPYGTSAQIKRSDCDYSTFNFPLFVNVLDNTTELDISDSQQPSRYSKPHNRFPKLPVRLRSVIGVERVGADEDLGIV
ncbi:uncharacterized protein LOC111089924 [Limulus polyphemus]|uniref:Uncharacterized protein LOC111089924 n=1 Tax=Limulus polyphemus TaxID=6850 RepID=A0ABM1TSQ2_LIMPO|nr:uncharacterized protein LOC111089924 [Limulus polyphemus]